MKLIILTVISFTLNSCIFETYKYKINNVFYLISIDTEEQMNLSYKDGESSFSNVVDATVFSIGYDRDFIIVKQHPYKFPGPTDKKVTNYYIVDIKGVTKENLNYKTYGPYSFKKFNNKRLELHVPPELVFTKTFKSLE